MVVVNAKVRVYYTFGFVTNKPHKLLEICYSTLCIYSKYSENNSQLTNLKV